jgi:hypothetical protein
MGRLAILALALCLLWPLYPARADQLLPWGGYSHAAENAYRAFLRSDHWIARDIVENEQLAIGATPDEDVPSLRFYPHRQLLVIRHDFNGDGRQEVILLFSSGYFRGNGQAPGVVMVRHPRSSAWRIGCEITDWGDSAAARTGIRLLASRSHGWRNFRTSGGIHRWRPVASQPGAMECNEMARPPPRRR